MLDSTSAEDDLPNYLLEAIFRSQKSDVTSLHAQLMNDLLLTIDWNCPRMAVTKVFDKDPTFKVDSDVFEETMLSKDREEFISIFLDNGFEAYKYVNSSRLVTLFENVLKEKFFREVCWEGVLGYRKLMALDSNFIDYDLNRIVDNLLGIPLYISSTELDECSTGSFRLNCPKEIVYDVARRRALRVLVIWALVSNRGKLAISLWKHVDQPVMLALACCLMLEKMKQYVQDERVKEDIEKLSQKFADMAQGVFDLCYNDMPSKAYDSLSLKETDWVGHSIVDMAAFAQNKEFVAHPCCQKWLTNTFMGNVKTRDLSWGFITFPTYLKVILCAFFIFPMYLWARFKETPVQGNADEETEVLDPYYLRSETHDSKQNGLGAGLGLTHLLKYRYPPLWKMILWMWSAPITKFWVSNIFYMIYLGIFSVAVIWPSCGNEFLDALICIWAALIAFDSAHKLYALKKITMDFKNFVKLVSLILIANGIAMQAMLYPDYPLTIELVRKAFHKAVMTFFMTPVGELQGTEAHCDTWEQVPSEGDMCRVSPYVDSTCSYGTSFWSYLLLFQYVILLKLILLTVLFALFANTGAKFAESNVLWKFQRYHLVTSFSVSLRLPPPLNVFSLIFILYQSGKYICQKAKNMLRQQAEEEDDDSHLGYSRTFESNYWKQLAKDYCTIEEQKQNQEDYAKNEVDIIEKLIDELNSMQEVIHRAKSQIFQSKADIANIHAHLESLKYREKKAEEAKPAFTLHSLSRESPYPKTKIERFPVPDKYVPWEVSWFHYEPDGYTVPKSSFSVQLQPFVDEDILSLKQQGTEKTELPVFLWNMEATDRNGTYRNRKSWIVDKEGNRLIYRLDELDLPNNPMGRTGLRGKGALPHWGPNHNIFTVITRWQKKDKDSDQSLFGTSDLIEFVETRTSNARETSLPGGFAWSESQYQVIQSVFRMDSTEPVWETSNHMMEFFRSQAVSEDSETIGEDDFKCNRIYRGYMDDQLNTDNAWKEVELWHVHYNVKSNIEKHFKSTVKWRILSEEVFIRLSYGQSTLLHDAIHSLHAAKF